MYQLKPGTTALITGARTAAGRSNIGKTVELFGLYHPGEQFVNPVNGVVTRIPHNGDRPLWLVTGEVATFGGEQGFAFVRADYLMPLDKPPLPQEHNVLYAR